MGILQSLSCTLPFALRDQMRSLHRLHSIPYTLLNLSFQMKDCIWSGPFLVISFKNYTSVFINAFMQECPSHLECKFSLQIQNIKENKNNNTHQYHCRRRQGFPCTSHGWLCSPPAQSDLLVPFVPNSVLPIQHCTRNFYRCTQHNERKL